MFYLVYTCFQETAVELNIVDKCRCEMLIVKVLINGKENIFCLTSEQLPNFWFGVSMKLVAIERKFSPWKKLINQKTYY